MCLERNLRTALHIRTQSNANAGGPNGGFKQIKPGSGLANHHAAENYGLRDLLLAQITYLAVENGDLQDLTPVEGAQAACGGA
jgi:hypothetical protein